MNDRAMFTPNSEGIGGDEPLTFDAAELTTEIASMHGFWLTPVNDDGHPTGPTEYFHLEGT